MKREKKLPAVIENIPGMPEQINSIQDVVDVLSYIYKEMWSKKDNMSTAESRFYTLICNSWAKQQIAAIKERDAHSPEVAAK